MAHKCPVCGCKCTCHGDIDDIVFSDLKYEASCTCCIESEIWTDEDENADIEKEILREAAR